MVAFLEEFLSASFDTTTLQSGKEALDQLASGGAFDAVILDLFMPEMTGFEFLDALRGNDALNQLPVLVLSGSDKSEDRIRAFEKGADDFVVKPFNPLELTARLNNLIRRLGSS